LNVSSVAGFLPVPNFAVYAASKAYVNSFTEALRAELRSLNISVTALCPGPVPTEFNQVAIRRAGDASPPPDFVTVPVQEVVRQALNGIARDRPRVIPGLVVRILMTVVIFIPMFLKRLVFDLQLRRQKAPQASLRSNLGSNVPSRI